MEAVGERDGASVTGDHPGFSIARIAAGEAPDRVVFSEYHGMGSRTAAYMVRRGPHKLIYYVDYEPQLFDLAADPEELNDLAPAPGAQPVLEALTAELFRICDPEAVDRAARAKQALLLAESGGKDAVIARGDLGFSVPPGVAPQFD